MSEEEKKAIEILKEIKDVRGIRQYVEGENEDLWALDIVYNLIERQQKEIKALEIIHNTYKEMIEENNYISKDKIREFIKEELPDDEIMECCTNYDVNGVDLRMKLTKLLLEED